MLQYHCLQCQRQSPLQIHQGSQLCGIIKVQQAARDLYTTYAGIQQSLWFEDQESVQQPPLEVIFTRKSCCFLLCHCLQPPVLGITGQSAWLSPGICLRACPWFSGLYLTFSIFLSGKFFICLFPPPIFLGLLLFGKLYLPSPLLSGLPSLQFFKSKQPVC